MSIQAMKMAAETLELVKLKSDPKYTWSVINTTLTALRAAIEAAEKVEPVAWLINNKCGHDNRPYSMPTMDKEIAAAWPDVTPLYTTPQPAIPAAWNPTDEELTAIYMKANGIERKNPPITTKMIFTAMRAMLDSQQHAIPDGMVLVPVEPTAAMIDAGLCGCMDNDVTVCIYKAMLAAAPKEPEAEEDYVSPEDDKTPAQFRAEGRLYCPGCFTFGHHHRKDCLYVGAGMKHHVSTPKEPT